MNAISTPTLTLWTLAEIAEATGGTVSGDATLGVKGVSIDTRSLRHGDLFVAIIGPNANGHDYVEQAFEAGAAACVVSEDRGWSGPVVSVADSFLALEDIARAARARMHGGIVGVTGSVGKTSTKEMLGHVLSVQAGAAGRVAVTQGNLNNHWGLPLSLSRMPADTVFGVFEMGMNHAGEIEPLSRMTQPHVALITSVEAVHIEFFDSIEGIARAKAEIMAGLVEGGTVVLPRDNPHCDLLRELAIKAGVSNIATFGRSPDADARLVSLDMSEKGSTVDAEIMGEAVSYALGVPGEHMVVNSLGVLAAVSALGADMKLAASSLASFSPIAGRGERHEISCAGGTAILIDDAYNASPASMKAAMQTTALLNAGDGGRRIAVLGDMLELGDEGERAHADLFDAIKANGFDRVYAVGSLMASLWSVLPDDLKGVYERDPDKLAAIVAADIHDGDVVLVKGSKGSLVSRVVQHILSAKEA